MKSTGTSRKLLVMYTDQVSEAVVSRLAADGFLQMRRVEALANPNDTPIEGWINSGYTKLRLWEQDDFDKLVYPVTFELGSCSLSFASLSFLWGILWAAAGAWTLLDAHREN